MDNCYKNYFYKKFTKVFFIVILFFIVVDIMDSGKITLFSFENTWNFILFQIIFSLIALGAFSAFITNLIWKIKRKSDVEKL
ncbi:hypothetical protein [Metabacillus fastidiosus]|uniref:hypothetical protein n=1 Tax=Metabacillus fastidiosus TaxID=1458 RepID=UPI00082644E1|nr:hypothetical protein [Metabacillus fastidiosus]MED4462113.1 hypothetical protein [Metabacillus fastidiosus]